MAKVRSGSKAGIDEHSMEEMHIEEQEEYPTATPTSLFPMKNCPGKCFLHLKNMHPVRRYELNFDSDRDKSLLDWLGRNTLHQAAVSLESKELSTVALARSPTPSSKDKRNWTRIFMEVVDYSETLNDDDVKTKFEQFLSKAFSHCEVSKDLETKEVSLKKLIAFLDDHKENFLIKFEDTGTTVRSETKPCFNESISSLEKRVNELQKELKEKETRIKNIVDFYDKKQRKIEAENVNLRTELKKIQLELLQTQEELGRVDFEKDRLLSVQKRNFTFRQFFNSTTEEAAPSTDSGQSSGSSSDESWVTPEEGSLVTDGDEEPTVDESASCSTLIAMSVQESREDSRDRKGVSLTNIPTTAVERSIYNNYKLLLLTISRLLLASDVSVLKEWARSEFSIQPVSDIGGIFTAMDRKRIITAFNLDQLRDFFEKIGRIDVVYLIECFIQGDYTYLRNSGVAGFHNISYKSSSSRNIISNCSNNENSNRNDHYGTVPSPSLANGARLPTERTIGHGVSNNGPAHTLKCSSLLPDAFNKKPSFVGNCGAESSQRTVVSQAAGGLVVTDGTETSNDDTQREAVRGTIQSDISDSGNGGKGGYSGLRGGNRGTRVDSGSNGQKLSKFERTTTSNHRPSRQEPGDDLGSDEEWLCNHYKRRCYVKFDCCNKYWPCHRCHNNQTKCGQTKLKSRDTKFVKCVSCGKEQQFGANGQYCIQCNAKFSNYFCAICKHLTGKDDHPYHCDKCGICRIHGDRSFHCDVCGVCLDVQLRGNHRCRAGSAHDECCICLEDAFTGCQILPCSHKVHKDCATQMIRSGITRCPICRESFAHKLERRTQPAKKPTGKI